MLTWAAITRIGAVAVPMSTLFKAPEIAKVVRHADLHGLFAQRAYLKQDFLQNFGDGFPEVHASTSPELRLTAAPFLRWAAFTGEDLPPWARDLAWFESAADDGANDGVGDEMLRAAEAEVAPGDPGMMIYTSGQSAAPKGVLHSQATVMTKTHYIRDMLRIGPENVGEARLPFFWIGGLVMTLFTTLDAGGTVVCPDETGELVRVFGAASKEKPDSSVEGARFRLGLGMTETFGMYSWGSDEPDDERPLCTPMIEFEPGYAIKVVDDDGVVVPDGVTGEILVRGPTLTLGLHKVERHENFDADGFYRTGDWGQTEGDVVYFMGRRGDMIKTSNANVSPSEVEHEILRIEGVASAHVVGLPDAQRGHVVGAAVVLEEGAALDEAMIRDTLAPRLSSYKVPRKVVFVARDELPVMLSTKMNKPALAALIESRWEESAANR